MGIDKGGYACCLPDPDEITLELVQPRFQRGTATARDAAFGLSWAVSGAV